ncbi:MAG: chalcone isomerase family protein [Betaproteobacteria bacterium]|nr:chalcone isomerase family protein [Betaproteobacteria bacterium]
MSASTRLRALSFAALLCAAAVATQPLAQAPAAASVLDALLPEAVRLLAPRLEVHGEGSFRWFGLLIYHARLWAQPGGWRASDPYALEIRYARHIDGAALAERSIEEMRHTRAGTDAQHQQWLQAMKKTFPDVRDGDRLIGLVTPAGVTRFFMNGKPIGDVDDPAFGPAFFGIWLSPATSRPDLRRVLLGLAK